MGLFKDRKHCPSTEKSGEWGIVVLRSGELGADCLCSIQAKGTAKTKGYAIIR